MKTRYFIFISFKGTSYHGWQIQPNSVTVQKILDEALSIVLDEKISTTGAGRTDTGVHALIFCAHFESVSSDLYLNKKLIYRLNGFLPKDISVLRINQVVPDAHARFSAISRTYMYYINHKKDPFREDLSWFFNLNLNIELMNQASSLLYGFSDFTSFCRLHSDNKTNICKIYHAGWENSGNNLVFTIKADRFLRNMVRAIVGTMAGLGTGKISIDEFRQIILAKDRSAAGISAPARGLFLAGIEYPDEIFI